MVWERELDIYGNIRKGNSNSFIPFLYPGQYVDIETGLAYNRFRYYNPETGLYLSKDPIGLVGGNKLYSYVNDSNKYIDILGLSKSEYVDIHRGTNKYSELQAHSESGYIMSDAARDKYLESLYNGKSADDALKDALDASKLAHELNLQHFGSLDEYMNAHTLKGTEFDGPAPRSMISFTTDDKVTSRFGDNVFSTSVPKDKILPTPIINGSESEVFVIHMIKIP